MRWLTGWLNKEAKGPQIFWLLFYFFAFCLAYSAFVAGPFLEWYLGPEKSEEMNSRMIETLSTLFSISFFYGALIIAVAAFTEELLFRFLPVVVFRWILGEKTEVFFLAAVTSSTIFGYEHGGLVFILSQGVVGFLWFMLYLKCGGFRGGRGHFKALATTSVLHFIFNMIIVLSLVL